jgi:hypothetical protein
MIHIVSCSVFVFVNLGRRMDADIGSRVEDTWAYGKG